MSSFLSQMKLLFGGARAFSGTASLQATSTQPVSTLSPKMCGRKRRDPLLEERARALLSPLAPQLAAIVVAGWNDRMRTTAGVAIAARWEVWLNPSLREISEEEVDRTLLHELAHLLAQHRHGRRRISPHGPEWRQACSDLGIPGEGRTHQLPFVSRRMKRSYQLRCPGCGESHERVRRPRGRFACLACCRRHNRGLYDERFRFEVIFKENEGVISGKMTSN